MNMQCATHFHKNVESDNHTKFMSAHNNNLISIFDTHIPLYMISLRYMYISHTIVKRANSMFRIYNLWNFPISQADKNNLAPTAGYIYTQNCSSFVCFIVVHTFHNLALFSNIETFGGRPFKWLCYQKVQGKWFLFLSWMRSIIFVVNRFERKKSSTWQVAWWYIVLSTCLIPIDFWGFL